MTRSTPDSAPDGDPGAGPSVLMVALSKRFGGADVRVRQMARALHGAGRRYAVAVLDGSELHRMLDEDGLSTTPLAFARSDPRLGLGLRSLILTHGYDVIDAHNPQSQYWSALAARAAGGRACVATVHSLYRKAHGALPRALVHEAALRLNRRMGSGFVAISASVHDYLRALGVPADRILLSRNGIEPALGRPEPTALRASLGWGSDSFVVAVVARLDPIKAHGVLLQAMARLRAGHPALRCLIVGEGREEASLRAEVARLNLADIVHFTGFRTDVSNILAEADAFCLPSLMEGIPYAALEAARGERPLIVSDVGGLAELFTDRRDACLVRPGCADSLADGLEWVMSNPAAAAALAAAARSMVEARFDTRRMVAETLALYDEEARRAQRRPPPRLPKAAASPRSQSSAP